MKKFLFLLLALPMLAFVATSCSDDDKDMPDVTLSVDYSGATLSNGVFTVEQGDTLIIEALKVVPAEGTKQAVLGPVTYFIDGFPQFTTAIEPFSFALPTGGLDLGNYILQARANIFQVDKTVAFGVFTYTINVVEKQSTGDSTGASGTDTPQTKITDHE